MTNESQLARDFIRQGKSPSCPIIDTHSHFGPVVGIYFPNPTAEGMIATMDRCGIAKLVFASHMALTDPRAGNPLTREVCRKYPGRLYGYWAVNPNYPEWIEDGIKAFEQQEEFVGFKFLSSYHRYPLTGDNYTPVYEYANANKCIILAHTWGNNPFCAAKQVEAVVKKYPDLTLLMGHSCSGEWDHALAIARDYPNAYLELTGIYHHNRIIDRMCEVAGSEKITFGTDLPWFDPHYGIGCVLFSHITDDDRRNILYRNAERIFGWSVD